MRFINASVIAAAVVLSAVSALSGEAWSADFLRDKGAAEALLKGKTLKGVYLRTKSAYVLQFQADGSLVNQVGAKGRWWVNETGQYCREWTSGRLQGNKACMDLAETEAGVAIFHRGKKVAEGSLGN